MGKMWLATDYSTFWPFWGHLHAHKTVLPHPRSLNVIYVLKPIMYLLKILIREF